MRNLLIILFIAIFTHSCNNPDKRIQKDFPEHIKLTATKKIINEIIKPVNLVIHNDYLIIQSETMPERPCFFVYSLSTLDFLYSFGEVGESENEFLSPTIFRNQDRKLFSIFDQRRRDFKSYEISATGASLRSRTRLEEPTQFPIQEASFINDSIFMYLTVDNNIVSYNMNSATIIDSLRFDTGIEDDLDTKYNQSLDFFHFSNSHNKIVTAHNFIDHISLNRCSDDGKFENKVTDIKNKVTDINSQLRKNIYQYPYIYSTSELILAQFSGYKFQQLQPFPINLGKRHFDFQMEVYDWNLNPRAILEFDNNILRCEIDEKSKKIITWDPLEDFEHLLVYTYDF
ncbi:BF3164 family lipoprotein [Sphingobacterium sp. UT-1RO-CII-1]|uniref:BF3164 family lipoprotein n=1 Tax=Sphingobacterium sp. UT-1RO-CII-1 TaxID=2995225 RepID=UPI00227C47CD|nr:BF3164 family lipoprotein [Sphingobacterium sp. UT-1RO-CII-1]MCY4778305.1 BF3164 family lipoprotein [Sphingobacterium sp. UT-1RO-CII-1]